MAPTLQKLAVLGVVFSVSMMGMDGCGPMDGEWKELTMKDNNICGIILTDSPGASVDEKREAADKTWDECKAACLDAASKDDKTECIAASVVRVKEVTRPAGKDKDGKDTPEEKVMAGECTHYTAEHSEHEISDKQWFADGGKEMENDQHCAKHLGGFAKYAKAVEAAKAEKAKKEAEAEKKRKEAEAEAAKNKGGNGSTGGENNGQSFAATGQRLRTSQATSQAMVVHHHQQVHE